MDEYYSTEDIAKLLNINILTVRRWIAKGRLPAYKLDRNYRIKRDDFEKFMEERKVKT